MAEGNLFFIKSRMHGKVMDVRGGSTDPGTQVLSTTYIFKHIFNSLVTCSQTVSHINTV